MTWLKVVAVVGFCSIALAFEDADAPPEQGCTFRANPSEFVRAEVRTREELFERVRKFRPSLAGAGVVQASSLPKRNFVDEEIFTKLDARGVASAPLSTNEEFVRRIYLDLTGRIPAAADVRQFLDDASPNKREELIERLLASQEFSERWATWFGDLLQNAERLSTSARAPQIEGRNSFAIYLRDAISHGKTVKTIAYETITATGNNYFTENGAANFPVLASTAMGPAQDTYDMMLVRSTTAYLGMAHYDCLLCHSGPRHLDGITLWGEKGVRVDAQRMAAHFSRTRLMNGAPGAVQYEYPLYNSTEVVDDVRGQYDLNTNSGNRPNRAPVGLERSVTPEYRDGTKPSGSNWRAAFAEKLTTDPMFGRNFANRLWKAFFGLGLVDPVETLDPARLDPKNPPPQPWTLQASHPELLEKLARFFVDNDTDLRAFVRLLVQSTAYQLSSRYDGEWKLEYVPMFARHYPRRLEGEEVHDAIAKATGVPGRYTWARVNGQTIARGTAAPQSDPVQWAMQLPDVSEPRNNGAVRDFMSAFYRGNRDTSQRKQFGSIQQQLGLMNDRFVTDRIKLTASPVLREIAKIPGDRPLVEELFLTFLSRRPTSYEIDKAVAFLAKGNTAQRRNAAVEDLAWALINKVDFVFSY
jgi:hypothetical protein